MARKAPQQKTIKKLFALSGNLCAFTGCSENMVDGDGNVIGEICHIEAASIEGERYNDKQNDEQRRAFENLILLCGKHHIVTNDVEKYKVADLVKMKSNHEKRFIKNEYKVTEDTIANAIISYSQAYINSGSGIQQIFQAEKQEFHNHYPHNDKEEFTIIDELFEYVLNQIKMGIVKEYKPDGSIDLTEKIALNFKTKKEREEVDQYLMDALIKSELIKKRFQLMDTEDQKDIHSHIFGKYSELKRKTKKNINVLTLLFEEFTPSSRKNDSKHINMAKALVLFFFEDCTIFEKTEEEKVTQTKLKI